LHALGEWDLLSTLSKEKWANAGQEYRKAIAPLAATASWGLGKFADMDSYLNVMKEQSPDRAFFASILNIHNNRFEIAIDEIAKARKGLDTELSSLLGESYQRAYLPMIRVQMLAELEEIQAKREQQGQAGEYAQDVDEATQGSTAKSGGLAAHDEGAPAGYYAA
jgi:FKBP12-rapamycin complex-associated protein